MEAPFDFTPTLSPLLTTYVNDQFYRRKGLRNFIQFGQKQETIKLKKRTHWKPDWGMLIC